jgi:hypothetical protein
VADPRRQRTEELALLQGEAQEMRTNCLLGVYLRTMLSLEASSAAEFDK